MKHIISILALCAALFATQTFAEEPKSININTATVEQLMTLKGIGEDKAKAIVKFRTDNGEFVVIEDLAKVKGIGKSTIAKNQAMLTVK